MRPGVRRTLLGLGVVVLLAVLAFAFQAWRAGSALSDARSQAQTLQAELIAGHVRQARASADDLRKSTHQARDNTDGPLWSIGAHLPLVGHSVDAVRTSARALDVISRESLPTLLDLAHAAQDGRLKPHHGKIDVGEIERLAPRVRKAAEAVDGPADAMAALSHERLLFPVSTVFDALHDRIATARAAIDTAADAFTVLPQMLGADGPRSYLLLIQNNAEIRATGGMPGSWAILHADHGHLSMGRQGSAGDLRGTDRPVAKLLPAERDLYGSTMATDLRDVTFTPDFPRAARMAAGILRADTGITVDGVFSVDPVALSYVLSGTGPVPVGQGVSLTAANAADVLLNGTYRLLPTQAQQDDFNETSARRIFDALVAGKGNALTAVRGLVTAAGQGRVLAWSRHPRVSEVIRRDQVSGALPGDTGRTAHVGVYLDDASASKMDYYLRQFHDLTATRCTDRGSQRLRLSTTLRSVAPRNITDLSPWVTGFGTYVPRGVIYLNVWLYAPYGGRVTSLTVDGRPVTIGGGTHKGRQVAVLSVKLPPGASRTIVATLTTGAHRDGDVVLSSTPGMEPRQDPVTIPSACD